MIVKLTSEEHRAIMNELFWLTCLERAGVDNWEGYAHALDIYYERYPDEDPTK